MPAEELTIRASLIDDLSAGIARARAELGALDAEVKKVDADSRKVGGTAGGANLFGRALDTIRGKAAGVHGGLLKVSDFLTGALTRALKAGVVGATVLAGALGLLASKSTQAMQNARLGVETFTGSVAKGDALFAQVRKFQGPFNITQLQEASQALLVATGGAEHLIPVMKTLTDISATQADPGGTLTGLADALQRIQEMGVIDTRTIRPLLTAGVPIYEMLASELGVPVEQVKTSLAKGAPLDLPVKFMADLEAETGPLARFQGAIDKQRKTITGQFQSIKLAATNTLADVFQPLGDSMLQVTPLLTSAITNLITGVGPQVTTFLTALVGLLAGLIPILQPIAGSLLGALATVLTAMAPALMQIAPQVPQLAQALADLVVAAVPLIPPLTTLTIALLPVMTESLGQLADAVTAGAKVITPVIDTFSNWLDRSSLLRTALADLLTVLLGYRILTTVGGWIAGLARSFGLLATAEAEEGAAAATANAARTGGMGMPPGLALAAGSIPLLGMASSDAKKGNKAKSAAEFVGGVGLIGAGIGSVVPGVGTVIGGGVGLLAGGLAYGAGKLFGDTPGPRRLGSTLATHAGLEGAVPGQRWITNAFVGGSPDSDHHAGVALDLVGSGLFGYAQALRAAGGYADFHGSHLHAVYGDTPSPRRGAMGSSGDPSALVHVGDGGALVRIGSVTAGVDVERAVYDGIRRYDRDRRERGNPDPHGGR